MQFETVVQMELLGATTKREAESKPCVLSLIAQYVSYIAPNFLVVKYQCVFPCLYILWSSDTISKWVVNSNTSGFEASLSYCCSEYQAFFALKDK